MRLPECAAEVVKVGIGEYEVGAVQNIEEIRLELDRGALVDLKPLSHSQVPVLVIGTVERIAARLPYRFAFAPETAVHARGTSRICKQRGVDVTIGRAVAENAVRDIPRPDVADAVVKSSVLVEVVAGTPVVHR